jgi:hypothetical protein
MLWRFSELACPCTGTPASLKSPDFGELLKCGPYSWGERNLPTRFGFGVGCPQQDEASSQIYSVPCQLNNLSKPLPQLVGKEEDWAKMRLRCLVESRPFLLTQYPVALVLRVRHRHLGRRIALAKGPRLTATLRQCFKAVWSLFTVCRLAGLPSFRAAKCANFFRLDLGQ